MTKDPEQLCCTVLRFITYLRSLDGDDKENGLMSAQNFENTLTVLASNFEQGVASHSYYIGGKGVLDRKWSESCNREVERFCDEIYKLIHPKWWQFWK